MSRFTWDEDALDMFASMAEKNVLYLNLIEYLKKQQRGNT